MEDNTRTRSIRRLVTLPSVVLFVDQSNQGFMAMQFHIFYVYEEQLLLINDSTTSSSFTTVFASFYGLILGFLQLKYQGKDMTDPFQTHPRIMFVAVSTLLVYWLLYRIKQKYYSRRGHLIFHGLVFFGSLSMACTISVLFPHFVRPLVYLLPAVEILLWIFKKLMQQIAETRFWRRVKHFLYHLKRRMHDAFYPVEQISRLPL